VCGGAVRRNSQDLGNFGYSLGVFIRKDVKIFR
jgi:hypothetical protein